ncbi:MAG: ATP-binding protein [Rhodothermales bacterium]
MISLQKAGENSLRFIAILLASAIFVLDIFLPGFNTGGILFQSLFILSLWIPSRQNNLMLAGLCTIYIAIGYWWRHGSFIEGYDLFSRTVSVLGVWSITVVASKKDKFLGAISDRERRIKSLIEERTFDDREQFTKKNQALQLKMQQMKDEAGDLRRAENVHRLAKETAEAQTRAKTAFMDSMSLEIQSPMQGIIEMASKLDETPLDSEQQNYIYTIKSAGESLLAITNDILDFSKIEAGEIDVTNRSFILRHCIEDAFDMVINRIAQKNIELSYTLDPSIPTTIFSDPVRVKQIIVNLLGNAVQRTTEGEIVISAKQLEKNALEHMIYFSVQDSGPSIPQDQLEKLFKTNSDDGNALALSDISLGMSISAQLCDKMGGKIWAENGAEAGAIFQFVINVEKASKQDIPLQGKPWFIGKHALIVDENANVRRFLNHQLKNWGMQTTIFTNGPEAMRWYSAGHVCDIALIDLDMPILDGLTLAHQMRQSSKDLPIMLMTMIGSRVHDPMLSATITKPIKQKRLYDQLNAILSLKSTTEAEYTEVKEKLKVKS